MGKIKKIYFNILYLLFFIIPVKAEFSSMPNKSLHYYLFQFDDDKLDSLIITEDLNKYENIIYLKENDRIICANKLVRKYPYEEKLEGIVDSIQNGTPGNYLLTWVDDREINYRLVMVPNVILDVVNDDEELCLKVYNQLGQIVTDAIVYANSKKMRYDPKSQLYITSNIAEKIKIKVDYQGNSSFFIIDGRFYTNNKDINFKKPFLAIARIVKDPVTSIKEQEACGYIGKIAKLMEKISDDRLKMREPNDRYENYYSEYYDYNSKSYCDLSELFHKDYSKYYKIKERNYKNDLKHQRISISDDFHSREFRSKIAWIYLNKPKYKPNDTIRVKAYVYRKGHKRIKKENSSLQVYISNSEFKKGKKVMEISPSENGNYSFEIPLHDSLNLILDNRIYVSLYDKNNSFVTHETFRYEDYELSAIKLMVALDKKYYDKGDSIRVLVSAVDENGMNTMDATATVQLRFDDLESLFVEQVNYPSLLSEQIMALKNTGETEFVFPSSVFLDNNVRFTVDVTVDIPGQEVKKESIRAIYYHNKVKLNLKQQNDTLEIEALQNGKDTTIQISVYNIDYFNNEKYLFDTIVPCKMKINPMHSSYNIKFLSGEEENISVEDFVQVYWKKKNNQITPRVDNPYHLTYDYLIYENNNLKAEGISSDSIIPFVSNIDEDKSYIFRIHYLWGGKIQENEAFIGVKEKNISLTIEQPSVIAPGQTCDIKLHVSDENGKPVKNADLTAYSITQKFGDKLPYIQTTPYTSYSKKKSRVSFSKNTSNWKIGNQSYLSMYDQTFWNTTELDTMAYYSFVFPRNSIARYEVDDTLTQFAPFVFNQYGKSQIVHVIYVDEKPVYFSWNELARYSFPIDSGFHRLKLRLIDRELSIDSVYFAPKKRTLIGVYENIQSPNSMIEIKPDTLQPEEIDSLKKYTIAYYDHSSRYIFVSNKYFYPVQHSTISFAGPIEKDFSFVGWDYCNTYDFEPGYVYSYDYEKDTLRKDILLDEKFPKYLSNYKSIKSMSDKVLTEKEMLESSVKKQKYRRKYVYKNYERSNQKTSLEIHSKKDIMSIFIMSNHDSEYLIVDNTDDGWNKKKYSIDNIKPSKDESFKVFVLYTDTTCVVVDNVYILPNTSTFISTENNKNEVPTYVAVNLCNDVMQFYGEGKEISRKDMILSLLHCLDIDNEGKYIIVNERKQIINDGEKSSDEDIVQSKYSGDNIYGMYELRGKILDSAYEPILGANIIIKGTTWGVVADENGEFFIHVNSGDVLEISSMGFTPKKIVFDSSRTNSYMNVILEDETQYLGDVIVETAYAVIRHNDRTGAVASYSTSFNSKKESVKTSGNSDPKDIRSPLYVVDGKICTDLSQIPNDLIVDIKILKDENATAIYGSCAANGVIIITTRQKTEENELMSKKSIRSHFSDYAFWQPMLYTDKNGDAQFSVTFPDDITHWKTYYIAKALKGNRSKYIYCSNYVDSIKSFLPISARLYLPNFMVKGDTCNIVGKLTNHTLDTIGVHSYFDVNGSDTKPKEYQLSTIITDTLSISPTSDTLSVTYQIETEKHFKDGEKRQLPIIQKGLQSVDGEFHQLLIHHPLDLSFDTPADSVNVSIMAASSSIMKEEVEKLKKYQIYCSEQTTSKLIGWIAYKQIVEDEGQEIDAIEYNKEKARLLNILRERELPDGTWGWWNNGERSSWISCYVIETLKKYGLLMNEEKILETYQKDFLYTKSFSERAEALKVLKILNASIDYDKALKEVQALADTSITHKMIIAELKAMCGKGVDYKFLKKYRRTTLHGNVYYNYSNQNFFDYTLMNTLKVYEILKNDSVDHSEELSKMRGYIFENIKLHGNDYYWHNTYESALTIRTILDDVINEKANFSNVYVNLKGFNDTTITNFPYQCVCPSNSSLSLNTNSEALIYVSVVSKPYWTENPKRKEDVFSVTTTFSDSVLKVGKETTLTISLDVNKKSNYMMINVPIPAGCSYNDKEEYSHYYGETHRECYKDRTVIFCEKMPIGHYTFQIHLIPRFSGTYILNPAKAELMYEPEFNCNEEIKTVKIIE